MEELKSLFGDNSLSYDEFEKKLGEASGLKLANLKSGNYVDKSKYDKLEASYNELKDKNTQLTNGANDLEALRKEIDEYKSKYDSMVAEAEKSKRMQAITEKRVDPKFSKFVYSELAGKSNDDFQKALEDYLKENKQYITPTPSSFVNLENGAGQPKSDHQKLNDLIRSKAKGN